LLELEARNQLHGRLDGFLRSGNAGVLPGKRGPQKAPTKKLVSLRLSPEVVEHFKASGPGWQTRIDSTLRQSIKKRA
jgi:uncharacterized protein (DUF4415 family)